MRRDGKPRSNLLKMLMVDVSTFNTFLAEFNIRATARLLQPWNEDSLAALLAEHRPDVVVFENAQRSTIGPLAARLAAASPQPFLPIFADAESPPESVIWPPQWAEPIPIPGSVDPLDLRDVIAKVAWEAHLAESKQWANPLTALPGNPAIRAEVERRIEAGTPFTLLYLDYDHFKAFNDAYGFSLGDNAIVLLAQIVREVVAERGNADDFVGHIGGDDFAVVTTPDRAEEIARAVIDRIGPEVELLYSDEDRRRGHTVVQRRRARERYPLMTLSIAGVSNVDRPISGYLDVSEIAAELKAHAKAKRGSNYVPDRRRGESLAMTEEREELAAALEPTSGPGGWATALKMPKWAQVLLVLNLVIAVFVVFLAVRVDQLYDAFRGMPTVATAPPRPVPPRVLAGFETGDIKAWSSQVFKEAIAKPERSTSVGAGKYSLKYAYYLPKKASYVVLSYQLPKGDQNWSKYRRLQFMMQRPTDGNTRAQVQVLDGGKYRWISDLGTGKHGWKSVVIDLSKLSGVSASGAKAPASAKPDWLHIRQLKLVVVGTKPYTGGEVLLDDIRLLP